MSDKTTKKAVIFSVDVETHSGNCAIAKESQKSLFQTQEEDDEDAGDTSVIEDFFDKDETIWIDSGSNKPCKVAVD